MQRRYIRTYILILALAALAVSFAGCFSVGSVQGLGKMTSNEFAVSGPISRIEFHGITATVNISAEKSDVATYRIHDNLLVLLDIKYENGVLSIGVKHGGTIVGSNIVFNIGADALEEINISGGVSLNGKGTFSAGTFKIGISGAVSGNLDLDAENVALNVSGAASMTLTGNTGGLKIDGSGASTITANDLLAREASVKIAGAATVKVYAEEKLNIDLAGAASVRYWGDPHVTQSVAGVGSVRKGD